MVMLMNDELLNELEKINAKGGIHYWIHITDLDTGLHLKVDQTGDGNVEEEIERFRVLLTKLSMYVKRNEESDLELLRLKVEVDNPEYNVFTVKNAVLETVWKSMMQNKEVIYGKQGKG